MSLNKPTIEELLALRDGGDLSADRARELEADARARAALHDLREIRQSLRELPDVAPGPDVWKQIRRAAEERAAVTEPTRPEPWYARFPMAAAASVFFATMIGVLVWQPFDDAAAPQNGVAIGDLVNRSQQLESQVWLPVSNAPTRSESALFLRLADIDAELTALDTRRAAGDVLAPADEAWRRALWTRRVQLLESLRTVQRAEQPEFTQVVY